MGVVGERRRSRERRRDWSGANRKLASEARGGQHVCRVGRLDGFRAKECHGRVERAHVAGRQFDQPKMAHGRELQALWVHPDDVVPLCEFHHNAYDARRFDLLPYLTLPEQVRIVMHLGIIGALRRLCGRAGAAAALEDEPDGPSQTPQGQISSNQAGG